MKDDHARAESDLVADGRFNQRAGWLLLLVGLTAAAVVDPWIFSEAGSDPRSGGLPLQARHAQGVVLAMGLLQLALAALLAAGAFAIGARRVAAWLSVVGAALYAGGYAAGLLWPAAHLAVLPGSGMNLAAFAWLLAKGPAGRYAPQIRLILPVACFGMLLDFTAGLLLVAPAPWLADWLGAPDGIRLRMLRLARVAAIALSVLVLLFEGLATRVGGEGPSRWARVGGMLLAGGAIGMPAVLAAACFTLLDLKYLLPLPATAVLTGVVAGLVLARKQPHRLEQFGWTLIAASLSIGMLMGFYAFEGPLPTPGWLGDYNESARRLSILAHSYAVVFGMVAIFLSRRLASRGASAATSRAGGALLAVGSLASVGLLAAGMGGRVPSELFVAGPLLVVTAVALCLTASRTRRPPPAA